MPDYNDRLKEERIKRSLTQSEMAELLGIKRSTYSLYESGKREPNIQTLQHFANILCTSLDDLIGYIPEPRPYPDGIRVHSTREWKKLTEIFADYTPSPTDSAITKEYIDTFRNTCFFLSSGEYTEEELEDIKRYAEFIKSKRDKQEPTD